MADEEVVEIDDHLRMNDDGYDVNENEWIVKILLTETRSCAGKNEP
jgi:hypothetical protein